jgi:DNA-binding IclR family transcriptional regulator
MAFTDEPGELYDRVREAGHYMSRGERDPDTSAVSVPVFGINNRFVGALGVTGLSTRFDDQTSQRVLGILLDATAGLGRSLGATRSPTRPAG